MSDTNEDLREEESDEGAPAAEAIDEEESGEGIDFPVVGIGASAGGLDAFKRLFADMPADSGMAFVLVQHLDPNHESIMAELIGKSTEMPVRQVTDRMEIEPDHVYMIPPNADMEIDGGSLHLTEPVRERGVRMPIDSFFRSLAEQCRERAICIVLSGTGSDGTLGLRAIKGVGGMAMAEDPERADYNGMPSSAIGTGLVDFVLPVEKMPEKLLKYVNHPYVAKGGRSGVGDLKEGGPLASILSVLRDRTEYDFRSYKKGTLSRRIERRMGLSQLNDLGEYLELVREDKEEAGKLFRDLLIGVTAFFRDPEAWEILERSVLAPMVRRRNRDEPVRVWVAGCSSGEEAYSVAILLTEMFSNADRPYNAQIFATDIDAEAIEKARAGCYPKSIGADMQEGRLARFFENKWNEYVVKKSLREKIVFAPQNLIDDPPFSKLDLICCRNLLIYLNTEVQRKIIPMFHFVLAKEGFLFLGNSESLGKDAKLFETLSKEWRILKKRSGVPDTRVSGAVRNIRRRAEKSPEESRNDLQKKEENVVENARRVLLDKFAPAAVLIDRQFTILYFHGPTGKYLEHPSGEPSHDLAALCKKELISKVRSTVHRVVTGKDSASAVARRVRRDGITVSVAISVELIPYGEGEDKRILVTFEDVEESTHDRHVSDSDDQAFVSHLEDELRTTREDLQSSIEEMETSNEELKASNEEVTSMNEELQTTNEELETGREELQSLNEELSTVNSELKDKVEELEAANNDLSNLLVSTDIATIFLDTEFRVRRFTPATSELISLIPGDVGRPLCDIASRVADDELIEDAQHVLDRLSPVEAEIEDDKGRCFIRRILPYRTHDNRIDGVVITFTDVTELGVAADLVQVRERQQAAVAELGRLALNDADLDVLFAACCEKTANVLGFEYSKVLDLQPDGKHLLLRQGVGWQEGLVGKALVDSGRDSQAGYTLDSNSPIIVDDLSQEKRFQGPALLEEHHVVSGMSVIIGTEAKPWGVLGVHSTSRHEMTIDDINFLQSVANILTTAIARRENQNALIASEQRYRLVTDSLPVLISYCDREMRYRFCNARYTEWFGLEKDEIIGKKIEEVIGGKAFVTVEPQLRQALKGESIAIETELEYLEGPTRFLRVEYIPDIGDDGINGVYVMVQDVTSRHEAQEQLRIYSEELSRTIDERTEELRILNDNIPAFFAYIDNGLRYRFVNKYYEQKFEEERGSLIGRPLHESISKESYSEIEPLLRSALSGETREAEIVLDIRKNGVRAVRARFVPRFESDGSISGVFMLADEVTNERRLQQEILTAVDLENERIGRDLHDSICQELSGISMLGKALSEKLRRQKRGSVDEADELVQQITGVTHRSRLLARGLSPVALENRTLCEALEELADTVENLFGGVTCMLEDRSEGALIEENIATQLYFITREAIFNAAKHGNESNIVVTVETHQNHLIITVDDSGGGQTSDIVEGMGIRSMRYRARTFGGSLAIEDLSDPNGLRVVCRLRIDEA